MSETTWSPQCHPAFRDGLNPRVRCGCGRETNADMVLDLRAVPPNVRAKWGLGELACDSCRALAFEIRRVGSLEELLAALGAPADLVERLAARRRTTTAP